MKWTSPESFGELEVQSRHELRLKCLSEAVPSGFVFDQTREDSGASAPAAFLMMGFARVAAFSALQLAAIRVVPSVAYQGPVLEKVWVTLRVVELSQAR